MLKAKKNAFFVISHFLVQKEIEEGRNGFRNVPQTTATIGGVLEKYINCSSNCLHFYSVILNITRMERHIIPLAYLTCA